MPTGPTAETAAAISTRVHELLEPVLFDAHFELVDTQLSGGVLQVLVEFTATHPRLTDPELGGRIDLDGVSAATRIVDEALEAADPIAEPYTLEVSSPGLERPLRKPAHYQRFLGSTISVKTNPGVEGERRIEGRLDRADLTDDGSINVDGRIISYADIDRARSVFVWGGQPKGAKSAKPGKPAGTGKGPKAPKKPHPKAASSSTVLDTELPQPNTPTE
jgi:ribosome maturation factor RimP